MLQRIDVAGASARDTINQILEKTAAYWQAERRRFSNCQEIP
jgi:hypothetical protein